MLGFVSDATLAPEIAALVNRVYADAEKGLWAEGGSRTTESEVADLIRAGEIVLARRGERVVGAVRVQRIEDGVGEFGMLVADPGERGTGIGKALVSFAENWALRRDLAHMQLELLVPREWQHPVKEFLRAWYTRLGYRVVHVGDFTRDYPALAPHLACPCDFLVFRKDLRSQWLNS
ncbi:Acetyltransferase (GNAT) domain-containing protein [Lentzea fradiae]|uniref:Acetyltransferase (GNAT) domain-containing protein n=1 Tax=Lentzea fradiae TaxID=200378 RepID=A0A1G7NLU9_9PSEU|nr:GNAT family N-acetyltransferase [Lentzea fradiae]SDF75064.1 Acetyltransferase (GNAT) domain-containing protein [Lentzea fradiae]